MINRLFYTLVSLFLFYVTSAYSVDYGRDMIITVEGDPISYHPVNGYRGTVTLSIDGSNKVFEVEGSSSMTWSSDEWKMSVPMNATLTATVSSSNLSNYRIHAKPDDSEYSLDSFYVEMGDDLKSRFMWKSEADQNGGVFPIRIRPSGSAMAPAPGHVDIMGAFEVDWGSDVADIIGDIRISLGQDSGGNWLGFLKLEGYWAYDNGWDGVEVEEGAGDVDIRLFTSANKRQISTPNNLVEIKKGPSGTQTQIDFYVAHVGAAPPTNTQYVPVGSPLISYLIKDYPSGNFKMTRTIGSETHEMAYFQDYEYVGEDEYYESGGDNYYWYKYIQDSVLKIDPWYDPSAGPTRRITGKAEFTEVEEGNNYYSYTYYEPSYERRFTYSKLSGSSPNYTETTVHYESIENDGTRFIGDYYDTRVVDFHSYEKIYKQGEGETKKYVYEDGNLGSQPESAIGKTKETRKTFVDTDESLITTYTYHESSKGEAWVKTSQTKKGSTVVSSVTNTYTEYAFDGEYAVKKSSAVSTGSGTETTVYRSYALDVADPMIAGKPISLEKPDDTKTSYGYQRGTWNAGTNTWTASSTGDHLKIITVPGLKDTVSVPFSYSDLTSLWGIALDKVRVHFLYSAGLFELLQTDLIEEKIIGQFGATVYEAKWAIGDGSPERVSQIEHEYNEYGNLTKTHNLDSGVVHYQASYSDGRLDWDKDVAGVQTTYSYDSDTGWLSSKTRESVGSQVPAMTTTYEYDAKGRMTKQTVGGQLVSEWAYDTAGRVTSEKVPGGYETQYSYDYNHTGTSSLTKTNPDGSTEVTVMHRDGRTKSVTGTATPEISYSYSFVGDELQTVETLTETGQTTTTRKDMLGRVIETERATFDGGTVKTVRDYNGKGQLVSEKYLSGTTPVSPSRLMQYDWEGRLYITALDVNNNGILELALDADTLLHQYFYLRWTDPSLDSNLHINEWHYRYTTLRYPQTGSGTWKIESMDYTQLSGSSSGFLGYEFGRDAEDNWTYTSTEVNTAAKSIEIGSNIPGVSNSSGATDDVEAVIKGGLIVSEKNAQGQTTTLSYDAQGRLIKTTDARNLDTTVTYYVNSGKHTVLPLEVTEENGQKTKFGYDANGARNKVEDHLGKQSWTDYVFDASAKTTTVYNWGNGSQSTKTVFDDLGRRTELHTYRSEKSGVSAMSGAGDKTTWIYDDDTGLLTRKQDAQGRNNDYDSYDDAGRLLQKTDPRGVETNYDYYTSSYASSREFSGMLRQVTYDVSGTSVPATPSEQYEYHPRMLVMKKMRQQIGTSSSWNDWVYTYDYTPADHEAGRLLYETHPSNLFGSTYNRIHYSYETDSGNYDSTGQLVNGRISGFNIYNDSTYRSDYYYTSNGRMDSVEPEHAHDIHFDYVYLSDSNLIRKVIARDGTVSKQKQERFYASNSNAMTQIRTNGFSGSTQTNITDVRVTRDIMKRITEHKINGWIGTSSSGGGSGLWESYTYTDRSEVDVTTTKTLNSNWTGGSAISTKDRNYDAMGNRTDSSFVANSLNQYTTLNNNGVVVTNETYDAAGNLTYDGLYTYTYDAKNQLVSMSSVSPSATYNFKYDPMGRRIERSGTGLSTRRYLYQGWNLIAEFDTGGTIKKKYTWGIDASGTLQGAGGVGGLLMIEDGSTRYYPVYDAKKNVIGLQNASGTLVAWYDYDPFGKWMGSGGSAENVNPFRFSTKFTDHEIDVDHVYFGLRYYHADLGRFLNRDPIAEAGGLNLYAMVHNNPVNVYDYLGMSGVDGDHPADGIEAPVIEGKNGNIHQNEDGSLIYEHESGATLKIELDGSLAANITNEDGSRSYVDLGGIEDWGKDEQFGDVFSGFEEDSYADRTARSEQPDGWHPPMALPEGDDVQEAGVKDWIMIIIMAAGNAHDIGNPTDPNAKPMRHPRQDRIEKMEQHRNNAPRPKQTPSNPSPKPPRVAPPPAGPAPVPWWQRIPFPLIIMPDPDLMGVPVDRNGDGIIDTPEA